MTLSIARYGHGHPVVFLPPALLSGDYYAEVLARAPEGFETWLVDLPDHERDEPEYDLAAMLDAVGAALDAVPRPFTLVGSSLGGYLAVHLAPRIEGLERLVVIGGLGAMPREMAAAYRGLAADVEAARVPATAAKAAAIEAAGGPRLSAADRAKLVDRLSSWPTERFVRCLRRVAELEHHPATESVQVGGVILHARDDGSVPIDLGRALATILPRAERRELEDGGHLLALTKPDLVAELCYPTA